MDDKHKARFWSKVAVTAGGCWPWTGAKTKGGYGNFAVNRKATYAHRLAYEDVKGPIPEGLKACHKCDNKLCCNPEHIYAGTPKENTQDAINRGLLKQDGEDSVNAKLTNEQVLAIRADDRDNYTIASEYGMSNQQISRIKLRQRWKHLA
jgi:hypothetical protein